MVVGGRVPDPDGVDDGSGYESDDSGSDDDGGNGSDSDPVGDRDRWPTDDPRSPTNDDDSGGSSSGDSESDSPDPPSQDNDSGDDDGWDGSHHDDGDDDHSTPSTGGGSDDDDGSESDSDPVGDRDRWPTDDPRSPTNDDDDDGGDSDSDSPDPSTPQGPTGTQPDGSDPPSQDEGSDLNTVEPGPPTMPDDGGGSNDSNNGSDGGGGAGGGGDDTGPTTEDSGPSELSFDNLNPRYDGERYGEIHSQIRDEGARNVAYAETDSGIVARYQDGPGGETRYTTIPIEDGSGDDLQEAVNEHVQQQRRESIASQSDDLDPSDVVFNDGQLARGTQEEIGQSALAEALGQETAENLQLDEDFTFDAETGAIELTPFAEKELAREQVTAEQPQLDPGEDFEVTYRESESGESSVDVSLTESGQETVAQREQDLRAAASAATEGSGEMARGTDATDFEAFDDAIAQIEQRVEGQNPGTEAGDDFTVGINESGEYIIDTTEEYDQQQREQANEGIAAQARSEGIDPERLEAETGRDIDTDGNVTTPQEYVTEQAVQQFNNQTDAEITNEDVQVVRTQEDGETVYRGTLTQSGETKLESDLETSSFTAKIPGSVPLIGGASTTVAGRTQDVEVDSTAEGIDIQSGERLGDIDWSFGLGGPGDEVENAVDSAGEAAVDASTEFGKELFTDNGIFSESLGQDALEAAGYPELGRQYEETLREAGIGLTRVPATVVSGASSLPFETAELAAAGVTQPVDTAQKIPGSVAGTGASAGSYAAKNPGRFTGELVGSVALTGGLFTATQGTRFGTASRWAIQPGEEAVKALARRGSVSTKWATRVPGVRENQLNTETAETSGQGGGQADAGGRLGGLQSTVSDASPVSVEADPSAGRLEIDPEIRESLAERGVAIRETPQRIQQTVQKTRRQVGEISAEDITESVESGVNRAVESTRETGEEAVTRTRSGIETGRQQFTRAELAAEDFAYRAGQQARATTNRLTSLDPRNLGTGRMQAALTSARQQVTRAELAAEDLGFRAGQQARATVNTLAALEASDLRPRGGFNPVERTRQEFTRAELAAEDLGFRAGQQVSAASETLRDAPETAANWAASGTQTARQQITRGELAAEEIGFRAGERTGQSARRLLDMDASDLAEPVQRELTAARFGVQERLWRARESTRQLSDLSIKVGDVEQSPLIEADAEGSLDEPAIRSQLSNPLDIEGDTNFDTEGEANDGSESGADSSSENSAGTTDTTTATGAVEVDVGGGQTALLRTETETEGAADSTGQTEVDTESATEAEVPYTAEPAVSQNNDLLGGIGGEAIRTQQPEAGTQSPFTDVTGELGTDGAVTGELDTEVESGVRPRFEIGGAETGVATEIGTRIETGTRVRSAAEIRQEARQEAGLEIRTGLEMESVPPENDPSQDEVWGRQPDSSADSSTNEQPVSLGAGWLNQYKVALAGGGLEARSDPEDIEQYGDGRTGLPLPTEGQVDPSEDLQEGLESVESLFFIGGNDSSESSDNDEDDWLGGLL